MYFPLWKRGSEGDFLFKKSFPTSFYKEGKPLFCCLIDYDLLLAHIALCTYPQLACF